MNFIARHIKSIIAFLIIILSPAGLQARDFILVLDPGHGGKDYGASGKITNEKSINLAVAKLVKEKIKDQFNDVKIVFTRENDKFISLRERADIANKAGGDLFISIHVNSVDRRNKKRATINGASVYTLGLHKSADNLEVAKRENSVMALEDDYSSSYEGFDPESAESYIIFELSQDKHMEQSLSIARNIQDELVSTAGRGDRGVRQAGYWVLWATSMPAVLVELDFICNPQQEKFMASAKGQEKMADAIANAFAKYKSAAMNRLIDEDSSTAGKNVRQTLPDHVYFRVQVLTSTKLLKNGAAEFKGLKDVDYYTDNSLYKYVVGNHNTLKEAEDARKEIEKLFPSAFIIKMKNGQRIK